MAFRFDADTKWLSATTNLPSSTNYTLCGWAQTNGTSVIDGMIATHWDYAVPLYNQIAATADGLSLYFVTSNGGGTNHGTLGTPGQNVWFFWALTCGGTGSTDSKAYYALPTDTAFSVISVPGQTYTPTHVEFGNDTNYNEWCNSTHGPIYMYDGVLTEAELFQQRSRYLPVRPDILNRWVDGLSGTTADAIKDRSGLGRDLTQNGTVSMVAGPPLSWGGPVLTVVSKPAGTTYANTVTETGTASEATIGFIGVPVTETVTATDTVAPASGSIFNVTVTETGTAGFTTTGGSIYAASTADSGTAGFTPAIASSTWAHTVTETGSASMTPSTVLGTGIRRGQSTGLQLFGQSGSPIYGAGPSTFSFGTAPSPGSAILVPINIWEGTSGAGVVTVGAITDSSGNTYTRVAQVTDATNRTSVELWAAFNIQVLSGTFTLSFTYSGYNGVGGHHASVSAEEFFGLKDTNQPDITGTYNAQNTVATLTGSGANTAAYELLVSVFQPYSLNSGTGTFTTTPTGYTNLWTNLVSDNYNATGSADYRITTAIETPTAAYAYSLDDGLADQGLVTSFKWVGAISTRATEAATATDFVTGDNLGRLTATLGNLTTSSAGGVLVTGVSTSTLSNLTTSSASAVSVTGTTSSTLDNFTIYDEAYDPNTITRGRSTGKNNFANAGSSSNFSFPAGLAPTAGSGVIVTLEGWTKSPSTTTFSISSMSDNQGNVYTKIASVYDATQRTGSEIWAAYSVVSSGTYTIAINYTDTAANNNVTVQADEFRNLRASGQPDQTATANSAGPATATTAATTSAVELVVSVASAYPARDGSSATITYPSGYRNLWGETADNNATGAADYQVVTSTGAQAAQYDFSTNTGNIGVAVATFFSSLAISGVVTSTLSNLTISATAQSLATATSTFTLASITGSSTAQALVGATVSATLGNLTTVSAGTNLTHGSVTTTLANLSLSAAGSQFINGNLAATLDALTTSSAATNLTHGSNTSTLSAVTTSSAGTVSLTGISVQSMAPITLSSAVAVANVASSSPTLGNLTLSSVSSVVVQATASNSIGSLTFSSSAVAIAGATLGQTLAALALTSESVSTLHGSSTPTLDALTVSSDGTNLTYGSATPTLAPITSVSSAVSSITGTGTPTLSNLALSSAGTESITGAGAVTLGSLTTTAVGTEAVTATATPTIGNLTSSITVANGTNTITNVTLANVITASTGTVAIVSQLNNTFDALTSSSQATTAIVASSSTTLPAMTTVSAGTVLNSGVSNAAITAITTSAAGTVSTTANSTNTLSALTLTSAATESITAIMGAVLGGVTVGSTGVIGVVSIGTLSASLGTFTFSSVATNPIVGTTSSSIGSLTLSTAGTVSNTAAVSKSIGTLSLSTSGAVQNPAVATNSIGALSLATTAGALVEATASNSIGSVSATSTGTVGGSADLNATLDSITCTSAVISTISGTSSASMGDVTVLCTVINPIQGSGNITIDAIIPAMHLAMPMNAVFEQSIGIIMLAATTRPIALGTAYVPIGEFTVASTGLQLISASLNKSIGNLILNARQPRAYEGRIEFPPGSGHFVQSPPGFGVSGVTTRVVSTVAGAFTVAVTSYFVLKDGTLKSADALAVGDVIKTHLTQLSADFVSLNPSDFTVELLPDYSRVLYLEVTGVSNPGVLDLQTTITPVLQGAPSVHEVCSCVLLTQPGEGNCGQQYTVELT